MTELILEIRGARYVGHVCARGECRPLVNPPFPCWRFAREGKIVAEFAALPDDTADKVHTRLARALQREESRERSSLPPQY